VEAVLQTTAPYSTGTVAVTEGSAAVTGTDTVWTAGMSGREFRVTGRDEIYTFTRTGNTTGTLDRNYEGDTYRYPLHAKPKAPAPHEVFAERKH
jgi:hypothetical protein